MKILKKNLQIAIDGLVGAGKSVGAHRLAQRLGILYVYTGAMYRATALLGIQNNTDLKDEAKLIALLKKSTIKLMPASKKSRVCDVFIDAKDVTDELFSSQVNWGSSVVGLLPRVRKYLVKLQQEIAKGQAVVMEGRDITTVVLPQADLKIFLTAELKIRAKRRLKDLRQRGEKKTLEQVIEETVKRDYQDSHRQADPLRIVKGAWVLDTSNLTIDQEVDLMIKRLKAKKLVS